MAKENKGWRKDVASGGRAKSAQPAWRKDAPAVAPTKRWSKKTKFFTGLVGTSAVIGLIVVVILWLWPLKPAAVMPDFALYAGNDWLPPNTAGRNGLQRLVQVTETTGGGWSLFGSGALRLHTEPKQITTRDLTWDKGLGDVKEKTVIVVLALHGGVDEQGAYFLADDLGPGDVRNRLRLKDVIERFEAPDLAGTPNKLLVLDTTQLGANWPFGLLHNDFARELEKLNDRILSIPGLVVMSASGPDQRSWVSEEWQTSIFLHLLAEGLRGGAASRGANRISTLDLFEYVRTGVTEWVQANRNRLQTPVLLPTGDAGRERAQNSYLVQAADDFTPADPRQAPGYNLQLGDLENLWKKADALANRQKPHPAAYSPHLYRQYLDKLLRYEHLVRMGDLASAVDEADRINRLEREIDKAREVRLDSLANSLALPTMLGLTGAWNDAEFNKRFAEQWEATKEKKWDELRDWALKQGGALDRRLFQVKVNRLLLQRATMEPVRDAEGGNLKKACDAMDGLEDPNIVRPVESHLMRIMNRDLAGVPPPAEDLQLALNTRRLAEQSALGIRLAESGAEAASAYPYSELVYRWIRNKIEEADTGRRLGEDRLLASDAKNWSEARKALQKAGADYQEAGRIAASVQLALSTRDEVLAALPYYGRWVGGEPISEDGPARTAQNQRFERIEKLWTELHRLDGLLAETPSPDKSAALGDQAKKVRDAFAAEKRYFDEECDRLRKETAVQQNRWHAIHDVLTVPFIEPSLRLQLLRELRRISQSLLVEPKLADTKEMSPDRAGELARIAAQRQGRLALATLGRLGFEAVEDASDFDVVDRKVRTEELSWSLPMNLAGRELGGRWRKVPERILQLADEAAKTPLERAAGNLMQAERLARLLDGPPSALLPRELFEEGRKLRMHDLLLWLAERTWKDHYRFDVDDDPNAPIYYQAAGDLLVADARKQIEREGLTTAQRQERQKALLAMSNKLKPPRTGLTFWPANAKPSDPNPRRLAITSERSLEVLYRVDAPAPGAPGLPGVPVMWLEPAPNRRLDEAVIDSFGQEKPQTSFTKAFPLRNEQVTKFEQKPPDTPLRQTGEMNLVAVFRGQKLTWRTALEYHRLPEVVFYQHRQPSAGRVSVRADKDIYDRYAASSSGIVILLDCSGSMDDKRTPRRFDLAINALKRVLQSVPRGTQVSLWAFSHKKDGALEAKDAEKSVEPITKTPIIRDPANAKQVDDLINKVKDLTPWNATPIVNAMVKAKKDLEKVRGFKTMLVLTDGMDTRFEKRSYPKVIGAPESEGDPELNPDGSRSIGDFLVEQFKNAKIDIRLVGFQLGAQEEELSKGQFEKPLKALGGKYHDIAKDVDALIKELEQAMRQRLRYSVHSPAGAEVEGLDPEGYDVNLGSSGAFESPNLRPGLYLLRVKTDEDLRQRIDLGREAFPIQLTPKGFQRVLFADDYPERRDRKLEQRWLLAALQNQYDKQEGWLQMLVTAEREVEDQKVDPMQQVRPQYVWLEVVARDVPKPFGLRWGGLAGIPAPAYNLDVARWPMKPAGDAPAPALPRLHAFIGSDRQLPIARAFRLNAPDGYSNLRDDFRNKEEPIDGQPVTIESVEFEDHLIETSPKKREPMPCLVVRVRHSAKTPVFVQIDPLPNRGGQEHRFYTDASKYTGVFWPVTKAEAENIRSLSIISVEALKSPKNSIRIELDLRPPDSDRRPIEPFPLELKPN